MTTKNDPVINKNNASGSGHKVFELFKILKSGLDALDRLYRPDRSGILGTVSSNSFRKAKLFVKQMFSRLQRV